jgi:hypothetical protein
MNMYINVGRTSQPEVPRNTVVIAGRLKVGLTEERDEAKRATF